MDALEELNALNATKNSQKTLISSDFVLSNEVRHLTGEAKDRYLSKVLEIGLQDPYLLPKSMFIELLACECVPDVRYPDIYNYLVHTTSRYTANDLKSYKSLDGYKYFVDGLVKEIIVKKVSDHYLIKAKVVHSQQLTETPTKVWIWIKEDGEIKFGHCTRMAGLGETCSHVAAVAFALESLVNYRSRKSCTSLPCQWIEPSASTMNVNYAEIINIDFTSPKQKKETFLCGTDTGGSQNSANKAAARPKPSMEEQLNFLQALSQANPKAAVLSVLPDFSTNFKKEVNLPRPLTELYEPTNKKLSLDELQVKANSVLHASSTNNVETATGICYCLQNDDTLKVIECKSQNCDTRYFHQTCMGLKVVSKKWMCPRCRTLEKAQKLSKK